MPTAQLPYNARAIALWGVFAFDLGGITTANALNLRDIVLGSPQARREAEQAKTDEACKALVDWAGAPTGFSPPPPPPPAGRRTAPPSEAPAMAPELRLFADEHFKPVFGKAFDELLPSERLALHKNMFMACQSSPTYGAAVRRISYRLGPPFADIGGVPPGAATQVLTAAVVVDAVQRMRGAGARYRSQAEAFDALPPTGASWVHFLAQRPLAEEQIRYLPPDRQVAAREHLTDTARRLAAPALAEIVAQAPAEGAGAEALPDLRRSLEAVAAVASQAKVPDAVAAARAQLLQRRAAIVGAQVAKDRASLQAIPPTLAGQADLAAWYRGQSERLNDPEVRAGPEVVQLMQEFIAKRQDQLAQAQAQWLQRIQAAGSNDELRQIERQALILPVDSSTPAGQSLMNAARARQEALYRSQVLGAQAQAPAAPRSAQAPGRATTAGSPPAADGGEPTAEEMFDTIQSALNQAAAEIRNMQSGCKTGARSNPMDALACITGTIAGQSGGAQPMKISQFRKLGCAPAAGQAGYVCDYVLGVSGGAMANMGSVMGSMLASGSNSQARFIRSGQGWTTVPMSKQ